LSIVGGKALKRVNALMGGKSYVKPKRFLSQMLLSLMLFGCTSISTKAIADWRSVALNINDDLIDPRLSSRFKEMIIFLTSNLKPLTASP